MNDENDSASRGEVKVVGNYSDPLAKTQPTAQEAATFEEWHPALERHGVYCRDKCLTIYRRGRAEGERNLRAIIADLRADLPNQRAREAALRAENARLREREYENSSLGTAEMDDLRTKLAAAEAEVVKWKAAGQAAKVLIRDEYDRHSETTKKLAAAEKERAQDEKVLAEYRFRFAEQADELDAAEQREKRLREILLMCVASMRNKVCTGCGLELFRVENADSAGCGVCLPELQRIDTARLALAEREGK